MFLAKQKKESAVIFYCCCSQFSWSICLWSNGVKMWKENVLCVSMHMGSLLFMFFFFLLVAVIAMADFICMSWYAYAPCTGIVQYTWNTFLLLSFQHPSNQFKHVPTIFQRHNWSNNKCTNVNPIALFVALDADIFFILSP